MESKLKGKTRREQWAVEGKYSLTVFEFLYLVPAQVAVNEGNRKKAVHLFDDGLLRLNDARGKFDTEEENKEFDMLVKYAESINPSDKQMLDTFSTICTNVRRKLFHIDCSKTVDHEKSDGYFDSKYKRTKRRFNRIEYAKRRSEYLSKVWEEVKKELNIDSGRDMFVRKGFKNYGMHKDSGQPEEPQHNAGGADGRGSDGDVREGSGRVEQNGNKK